MAQSRPPLLLLFTNIFPLSYSTALQLCLRIYSRKVFECFIKFCLSQFSCFFNISVDFIIVKGYPTNTSGREKCPAWRFSQTVPFPYIIMSSYHSHASTRPRCRQIPSRISVCRSSTVPYLTRILFEKKKLTKEIRPNFRYWNISPSVHRSCAYTASVDVLASALFNLSFFCFLKEWHFSKLAEIYRAIQYGTKNRVSNS